MYQRKTTSLEEPMASDTRQVSSDGGWGWGRKKPKEVAPRGKENKVDDQEGPGDSTRPQFPHLNQQIIQSQLY